MMKRSFLLALLCGAIPLIIGIVIFLLWLFTRGDWLMKAGIFTIYGGVGLFVVGAAALMNYFWTAWRNPDQSRKRLWLSSLACAALLFSNFVVAGGIVLAVIEIETRFTVEIRNDSTSPLNDLRIFGGGVDEEIARLEPGERLHRTLDIRNDGLLNFSASHEGSPIETILEGYVTQHQSGEKIVRIKPDGSITVDDGRFIEP